MKKVKVVGNVPSNTNCNLYLFKSQFFKDKELRVVKNAGECYWFVATDIAKILDYKQIDKISKTIVEEKNKTYYQDTEFYSSASSLKLLPNSILINEDGIKNIIAKTKSKQAGAFKEWINNEVLPKLREEEEVEKVDEEEEEEEENEENEVETDGEEEEDEEDENKNPKLSLISNDKNPLVINTIEITTRKVDNYINLTALCKAGNKDFKHWKENKKTKGFLQVLSSSVGIPSDDLIKYETGSNENRATWGHPQVAINIAQWISPEFDVQVSKWIFELLITGKVELGKEKSNEELENIYKEKLSLVENQLENTKVELKAITNTHNNMLKRQKRTAYEIGNVIYIVSNKAFTMYCNDECYKFGKATQTRDETTSTFTNRLSTYNTCSPINFDVEFLIYVEDNTLVENNIKARFRKDINPTNKEWLKGIKLSVITEYIISLCELINIEYNVAVDNSKNITPEDIQLEVQEPIVPIQVLSTTPSQIQEPIAPTPVQIQPQQQIAPIQNELFDKYKKILNEIDGYLRPKLIEIARELNLTLTGLKNVLCSRIKVALENKIKELQKKYQCKVCKKFNVSEKRADKCVECGRVASRKVVRPSYDQLIKDTRVMSMVKVGQKYGVSDNAVRKWIKGYRN